MSLHGLLAGAGALGVILMVVITTLLVVSAIYLGFGMRRAAIAHEEHVRAMWAIATALARSAPGEHSRDIRGIISANAEPSSAHEPRAATEPLSAANRPSTETKERGGERHEGQCKKDHAGATSIKL